MASLQPPPPRVGQKRCSEVAELPLAKRQRRTTEGPDPSRVVSTRVAPFTFHTAARTSFRESQKAKREAEIEAQRSRELTFRPKINPRGGPRQSLAGPTAPPQRHSIHVADQGPKPEARRPLVPSNTQRLARPSVVGRKSSVGAEGGTARQLVKPDTGRRPLAADRLSKRISSITARVSLRLQTLPTLDAADSPASLLNDCETQTPPAPKASHGGYCEITPGQHFGGRYIALRQLGKGRYSTVWLMHDTQGPYPDFTHFVAVKVIRSCTDSEGVRREANLLHYINSTFAAPSTCFVATILDEFSHTASSGQSHLCLVFKLLGPELLRLVEERKEQASKSLPLNLSAALSIFKCILNGVAGLHAHDIVHTDLKPENVLLAVPDKAVLSEITAYCREQHLKPPMISGARFQSPWKPAGRPSMLVVDLARPGTPHRSHGSPVPWRSPAPCPVSGLPMADRRANIGLGRPSIATQQTPPPAVMSGIHSTPNRNLVTSPRVRVTPGTPQFVTDQGHGTQVLLGDFGLAMVLQRNHPLGPPPGIEVYDRHPIVQNNKIGVVMQTREYRAPEVILGQDFNPQIDIYSVACIMVELITGDYLWDPKNTLPDGVAHTEENVDIEHLQHMVAVLGAADLPRLFDRRAARKEKFFDSQGNLRAHRTRAPNSRPLTTILRPHIPSERLREQLVSLLQQMLSFHPLDRPSATECLSKLEAIAALVEEA